MRGWWWEPGGYSGADEDCDCGENWLAVECKHEPFSRSLISSNSIRVAQWCNNSRLYLYLAAPRCECVKRGLADEHAQCVPSR